MTIEIHQPQLEALIQQRLESGLFQNIEEVLIQALQSAPLPKVSTKQPAFTGTGADLIAAFQAMPYKDEVEFEHSRPHLPVRDITF
jgi:hypothetical protein